LEYTGAGTGEYTTFNLDKIANFTAFKQMPWAIPIKGKYALTGTSQNIHLNTARRSFVCLHLQFTMYLAQDRFWIRVQATDNYGQLGINR
jgi:hypothetical protein